MGHGHGSFCIKVKIIYLGIVADECNISAVSRQLVVICLFFSLRRRKVEICHTSAPTATQIWEFVSFSG